MKFFIDTAHLDDIKRVKDMGLLDGVTTNPTLAGKEGGDFRKLIAQICEIVQGPVSAEVVSIESAKMVAEGKDLASISEHVVVKLPTIPEGVKALSKLVE